MSLYADVAFALPLPRPFTYAVPEPLRDRIRPGIRVLVPLGPRRAEAFVVRVHDRAPDVEAKAVLDLLDAEPVVPDDILDLTARLSRRFYSSQGEMLKTAVPPSLSRRAVSRFAVTPAGRTAAAEERLTPAEARLAACLGDKSYSAAYLKRRPGLSDAAATAARMVGKGWLSETVDEGSPKLVRRRALPAEEPPSAAQLNLDFRVDAAVAAAIRALSSDLLGGGFSPALLTGPADKRTAALLALCGEVLAGGRSVLVLFPEIGMSLAASAAFAERLGEKAVLLHGRMTDRARAEARARIAAGGPLVVAGARSAVLIPIPALGLIAVEEESDDSHLQAESPAYDARTAAWMRAEAAGLRLVLSAEAPRVETYERARRGGWLVEIPGPAPRPAVIADDRGERGILAPAAAAAVRAAADAGRKVLVFTRRRGFASLLFCPRCGHVPACGRCGTTLALAGRPRRLACRNCGETRPVPTACESCGGRVVEPRGPGVEAVEEEMRRLLPGAAVAGFDPDRIKTASAREAALARFASGRTRVLVGSPLLAHQSGLAPASLVVLMNPEGTLGSAGFRASARLYHEIRRALRFLDPADPDASAVLQTSWPDHFALRAAAAGDAAAFYEEEIFRRRSMGDPPFAALAEIVLSGGDPRALGRAARDAVSRLKAADRRLDVLGPAETARPAGRRGTGGAVQIVVRADDPEVLDAAVEESLRGIRAKASVVRAD